MTQAVETRELLKALPRFSPLDGGGTDPGSTLVSGADGSVQ
jgi:hypothetical protein